MRPDDIPADPNLDNTLGDVIQRRYGRHQPHVFGKVSAMWPPETSDSGWVSAPDTGACDASDHLWILTDQRSFWHRKGKSDRLMRGKPKARRAVIAPSSFSARSVVTTQGGGVIAV